MEQGTQMPVGVTPAVARALFSGSLENKANLGEMSSPLR